MRYFVFICYNGANYNGFQKQSRYKTVQSMIETSLKKIFKSDINITIGSRTDSGVHSYCNCFHFDLPFIINCSNIKECLNKILPLDIAVLDIKKVVETAHSRFSATKRRYRYIITSKKNPFEIGYYYNKFESLDVDKMDIVSKYLIGETNFKTFSKINKAEKHDYSCIIYDAFCVKSNDKIIFEIEGNRFTHNLVRCIIFNLIKVGLGDLSISEFKNLLMYKNMKLKNGIAPPDGLILINVHYDCKLFNQNQ